MEKFFLDEEETWRQKSRATWLLQGDRNTNFFHHYASHRKNRKALWEILDENGNSHSGQEDLETEAKRHFKYFYADTGQNIIIEQVSTVQHYPCFYLRAMFWSWKNPVL
jgi:hypothetical protein